MTLFKQNAQLCLHSHASVIKDKNRYKRQTT